MEMHRTINRRGEGDRLREEVLLAATGLLGSATSRHAVTLRAIARAAGIAAPSIYRHFTDRDAILDAVVSRTFLQLELVCRDAASAWTTGLERTGAIASAYVEFAATHRSEYRILFERSVDNLGADPHLYPDGLQAFGYLSQAIEQMVAEGTSSSDDAVRDAQALWAALHGLVTLLPVTPAFPWPAQQDLVDRLVHGLTR